MLDVISIGTSKEQGIKNENNNVFAFIPETDKNPLLAQIPFGGATGNNIGSDTAAGLLGVIVPLTVNATPGSDNDPTQTLLANGKKLLKIQGGSTGEFTLGEYLKGGSRDLVKIIIICDSIKNEAIPIIILCILILVNLTWKYIFF